MNGCYFDADIHNLILTNAAGSLHPKYPPGSVMFGTRIAKETVAHLGAEHNTLTLEICPIQVLSACRLDTMLTKKEAKWHHNLLIFLPILFSLR